MRADSRMDNYMVSAIEAANTINRSYRDLKRYVQHEIESILKHIGDEDSLAYEYRMKRLNALLVKTESKLKTQYGLNEAETTDFLRSIIPEAYYHTVFDVAQASGEMPVFAPVNERLINTIIRDKWSGDHYSKRIWKNNKLLEKELRQVLTTAAMTGESIYKTSRRLNAAFNTAAYNTQRIVRTETTYACNQAELQSYAALEIERYEYYATLDTRTSPQCRQLDGQVFPTSEAQAGKNLPPMHPNCRSTTVPYFENGRPKFRTARDKDGKRIQVPADMKYDEWYKKYIDPNYKPQQAPQKPEVKLQTDFFPEGTQSRINEALSGMDNNVAERYRQILENPSNTISTNGTAYSPSSNRINFNQAELETLEPDIAIHEATHYQDYNTKMQYEETVEKRQWKRDANGEPVVDENGNLVREKVLVTNTYEANSATSWIDYAYNDEQRAADWASARNILGVNDENKTQWGDYIKPEEMESRRKNFAEWAKLKDIPERDMNHITDVMSSFTEDQLPFSLFYAGHDLSYWNSDARKQYSECIAAYSVLKSRNSKSLEAMKEICPNLFNHIETVYKEMWK